MKWSKQCCVLILVVAIGAFGLRLPRLGQRPMHADEAVGAAKFGGLLEEGKYKYNPEEYHGPTLNYLTLIPAWLSSAEKLTEVSEFTLRIVPVFFTIGLLLLLLLLANGLGRTAAICAAMLTAVSPAFVFYSRYYIHEMLLVFFSFGVIVCSWRYMQSKNMGWAFLAGIFLGLCHATKETCIIVFGSMVLAILLIWLVRWRQGELAWETVRAIKSLHVVSAIAVALIVSALFHSSFLTNPRGILDSLLSYGNYLNRAGQNQVHIHPWYYYLKMLIYWRYGEGPVWSEALIVALAGLGFIVVATKSDLSDINFALLRFIAFYTLIMTVLYCATPYKTPWCVLGFLHGMILLAGVGAAVIIQKAKEKTLYFLVCLLLVAGVGHLAWQAYLGSYKYYADVHNPYVYAHTSTDIFVIAQRVKDIAEVHPAGYEMPIAVICPENYWPVPWYLGFLPNVGYWKKVEEEIPAMPVIIASMSIKQELMKKLDESNPGKKIAYVPAFNLPKELRPGVELIMLVSKELWDSYEKHQVQSVLLRSEGENE